MAHVAEGVRLEQGYTVTDVDRRDYGFDIVTENAADIRLDWNGALVGTELYDVVLRDDGSGGIVHLLTREESVRPLLPNVGDTLRIYRDTTVSRVTGLSGAAETAIARSRQIEEELAGRVETHATLIGRQRTDAQVQALGVEGVQDALEAGADDGDIDWTLTQGRISGSLKEGVAGGTDAAAVQRLILEQVPRVPEVVALQEQADALRESEVLVDADPVEIATLNLWVRVGSPGEVPMDVTGADEDAELVVTFAQVGQDDVVWRLTLAELLASAPGTRNTAHGGVTGLSFYDAASDVTFWLGRTGSGRFLVSANAQFTVDSPLTVTIAIDRLDVTEHVRLGTGLRLNADREIEATGTATASVPNASMTQRGVVELANTSETDTAVGPNPSTADNERAMTPRLVGRAINTRVPRPGAGDAGQFLEAVSAGNARWGRVDAADVGVTASGFDGNLATDDDTLQKVAQKVDDLVLGGDDTEWKSVSALPAVADAAVGDRVLLGDDAYELIAGDNRNTYHGIAQDRGNGVVGDDTFSWDDDPTAITFRPLRANLVSTLSKFYIRFTGFTTPGHTIYEESSVTLDTGATGGLRATYRHTPGDPGLETEGMIGRPFTIQVYTDAGYTSPYAIVDSNNKWVRVDRRWPQVAAAARSGSPVRWTRPKLPADVVYTDTLPQIETATLFAEQFPGLTVNRTDTDMGAASAVLLSPEHDLDTDASGEFHLSLELSVAPVSDVNMGFVRNKANQTAADRQRAFTTVLFASDLLEEDVFTLSGREGLTAFAVPLYSANTLAGTYYLFLVRDSQNRVAVYRWFDGEAGSTGATFTAELRCSFTPRQAAVAPTGGGGGEPEGVLAIALSGAFSPATEEDRRILGTEWEGNAGFRFTGGFTNTANSEANPYIVGLPSGLASDSFGTRRYFQNDSTAWLLVMTRARRITGGRTYRGTGAVIVPPGTGGVLCMESTNNARMAFDYESLTDDLLSQSGFGEISASQRVGGNATLTEEDVRKNRSFIVLWSTPAWANGNEIRFPVAGTWDIINWGNRANITFRGFNAARRTVTTNGGGAAFTINVTDSGDVNFVSGITLGTRTASAVPLQVGLASTATIPAATSALAGVMSAADKGKLDGVPDQMRVGTVNVPTGSGRFQVNFGTAFTGSGVPSIVVSASTQLTTGAAHVQGASNTGFTVARGTSAYTLMYAAFKE